MIGYCPAVYFISYFLLYAHVSNTLCLDRGRSEFRVKRKWGIKFQRGFRGKDRLFTALSMIRYFLYLLT